jgi:hypothetical protein
MEKPPHLQYEMKSLNSNTENTNVFEVHIGGHHSPGRAYV